ncbi:MAG: DUF434 domain-containing protein [Myxococcales bacterium]|nr:DUF434 domain-containing protein [Myxococcales bacterium]
MNDRRHRGQHPRDHALFAPERHPALRRAVEELSWLQTRGYADASALKLVGDRHGLTARQRKAALRCACSDAARDARARKRVELASLAGAPLAIDGFNLLITIESLLSGGFVFVGRDRAHRDLASVHGTYRMVAETGDAVRAVGGRLTTAGVGPVTWYLDRPVSNSGRLRARLLELAAEHGWDWDARLVNNPDHELARSGVTVSTSDAWILDSCEAWVDIVHHVLHEPPRVDARADAARLWLVDLSGP